MTESNYRSSKWKIFFSKHYKQRWYFEPFITINYKPIHPNISKDMTSRQLYWIIGFLSHALTAPACSLHELYALRKNTYKIS